jgi:hypothetical protein
LRVKLFVLSSISA